MSMQVRLKLYGVFRSAANAGELSLEVPDKQVTVRSAIQQLVSREKFGSLKSLLLDTSTSDPRPNALIMVSGKEINSLKGLDTELSENDELALLPIAHGG
jgi:molybdopterin converting factor small subunit